MRTGVVIVAHSHWLAVVGAADSVLGSAESLPVADVDSRAAVAGLWLVAAYVAAGSVVGSSPVAVYGSAGSVVGSSPVVLAVA